MKRLLVFSIMSAAFGYGLFASDSLPFPVSVGGQAAKDGTPFAKIENPVAADAELSVESKDGMIIANVHAVNAKNEPVPGSTPAVILLQRKTKTKLDKTMDGKKLAAGNYVMSMVSEGKTASIPSSPSSSVCERKQFIFAADPKRFTIETAGLGRFLHDRAVRWIPAKPVQSPPLLTPNF
jgi:hypothetical protein